MENLTAASLKRIVETLQATSQPIPCSCALGACKGWESFTESRWPAALLRTVGTLRVDEYEPTLDEHHPNGTRYESPAAPIAPLFYPYNRCDAFACGTCRRVLLRYTEFGGYYVDHRVREADAALIV
jgi:hypothetical protein